jgi:hypothetical protein
VADAAGIGGGNYRDRTARDYDQLESRLWRISAVKASFDLFALLVALGLLAIVFRVAARTRSRPMRLTLFAFAALVIALMLWNLAVNGGFHAV